MRLEEENNTEAVEREQCVELLKAMLAFDADERITPCEILTHPFITKVYRKYVCVCLLPMIQPLDVPWPAWLSTSWQ